MSNPDLPSTRRMVAALLNPRHRQLFETATRKALGEEGDAWACNFIRSCPASHGERLVLQLAYALWRGYGPAIQVDQLWGVEADVAERVLAGLAVAMGGGGASGLLARAQALAAQAAQATAPPA